MIITLSERKFYFKKLMDVNHQYVLQNNTGRILIRNRSFLSINFYHTSFQHFTYAAQS